MKIIIKPHPRLLSGVEVEVRNLDDVIQDTVTFIEESLEASVNKAKIYAKTFFPQYQIEDLSV